MAPVVFPAFKSMKDRAGVGVRVERARFMAAFKDEVALVSKVLLFPSPHQTLQIKYPRELAVMFKLPATVKSPRKSMS